MTKKMIFFLLILSGCTSQKTYYNSVMIKNVCSLEVDIYLPVYVNNTRSSSPYRFHLHQGESKLLVRFITTDIDHGFSFFDYYINSGGNYRFTVSSSGGEKIFNSNDLIRMSRDISTEDDRNERVRYIIDSKEICP